MRRNSLLLALVTCFAFACSDEPTALSTEEASTELVNRNWLDVWPQAHDDRMHVYRFTPAMGGGVFQDRNVFEGTFELFTFSEGGGTITFRFPGKNERRETAYRIERIDGPHPFTRRLVIDDDPRGPGVYYGYDERHTSTPFVQ